MPYFDLPLEELQRYKPDRDEPADFDAFWHDTLAEAASYPLNPVFTQVSDNYGLTEIDAYDVQFSGYGGDRINGWLMLPAHTTKPLPCIVEYLGYGRGRSFPYDWLVWASAGYAHFVMDTRGQGSTSTHGDTPDTETAGNPQFPGFMTRGILDKSTYYYRRVFTDAVRALETTRSHDRVDSNKIAIRGTSQGGGITLAVAGLVPDLSAALPNVPFLCHYKRATTLIDNLPYEEIARFCRVHRDKVDTVFNTLAYFDGINFAARAKTPALFSVGLMDNVCPPSTVYAAYNHYSGPKKIQVWQYNYHDGGGVYQMKDEVKYVKNRMH